MNTDPLSKPPKSPLPEAAGDVARRAADTAKETAKSATTAAKDASGAVENAADDITTGFTSATKDAAKRAADTAKDLYHSAASKAEDALETSKDYVGRNPVSAVLGAVAVGAAIGYLLMAPRRKPTFSERYADEPLAAVRDAILEALAPVTQRVHKGYDAARDGAGRVADRVHHLGSGHNGDSFSDQVGRIGSHLKFW